MLRYPDALAAEIQVIDKDAPAPGKRQFSFLEFMDLFTDAEQLAIAGAAMTDAPTKLWYDRAVRAEFIDRTDPRLAAGVDAWSTRKTRMKRVSRLVGLARASPKTSNVS